MPDDVGEVTSRVGVTSDGGGSADATHVITALVDQDQDQEPDAEGRCPSLPNTDQEDRDSHGTDDVCDHCLDVAGATQSRQRP